MLGVRISEDPIMRMLGWEPELLQYNNIVRKGILSTKIQLPNKQGEQVTVSFPHKPWVDISYTHREVKAPLWFCLKHGLVSLPTKKKRI